MSANGNILWQASDARRQATHMQKFARFAAERAGYDLSDYRALHAWSITDLGAFWQAVADFCKVKWQTPPSRAYVAPPARPGLKRVMRGATWFPDARLNYAENVLPAPGSREVLVAHAEGAPRRSYTADELRAAVARCARSLDEAGVRKGDRVAGVLANGPEAIIGMLAASSLGAIWSSCSPDFGASAIVDRLSQVGPKVLFYTSAYVYNGKRFDCRKGIGEALAKLPSVTKAVAVAHLPDDPARGEYAEFLAVDEPAPALTFASMRFEDPLYILFSSGTTGVPKCIAHGVGGTLLQHEKELLLHSDVGPGDRLFYYTTCGWMMWNWMASALGTGASLVVYDGAVNAPDFGCLWRIVRDEGVTHFGTSPKFLAANVSAGIEPSEHLKGAKLRTMLSTGSPLLPEQFVWVYEHVGKDLHLASISGGTDIVSCFMLGTPLLPVRAGEIQYAGLGMAIEAWDDDAKPVDGRKGELVCVQPFVSMPVKFWNDPDGSKYERAYFDYYLERGIEVWRHGDYVEVTPNGGIVVYGRSDATLNPGGVRIGTAELYRQVETLPEVLDSLAVGRRDQEGDTEIVLFVKLRPGYALDQALTQKIKTTIRTALTPRHVPKEVVGVRDIPYTRSGKKVEIAVTQAIHGEPVQNMAALANPESMDEYFAMAKR